MSWFGRGYHTIIFNFSPSKYFTFMSVPPSQKAPTSDASFLFEMPTTGQNLEATVPRQDAYWTIPAYNIEGIQTQ
jgi:hypothetical protein